MAEIQIDHTQYHKWLRDDTVKVKLERGQKGTYAWELTAEGENPVQVLERLAFVDGVLRKQYPPMTHADPRD